MTHTPEELARPVIYHGTPLTPRAALEAVMPGRAACVSFFRPDDLEAVLAVCPQVMFRPWSLFLLDAGHACREGMGRGRPSSVVERLLQMVGAGAVSPGAMGDHAGQPGGAFPAQRRASERLAVWRSGLAGMAHGWVDREACSPLREVSPRLPRLDRRSEERASGMRRLSSQDGGSRPADGQYLAPAAHAAGNSRGLRLSVPQRRQHLTCAERSPL